MSLDSAGLVKWLRTTASVSASEITCQKWLSTTWSTAGKFLCIQAVEEAIGIRLRLPRYKDEFVSDEAARLLSDRLSEGQPPAIVSALLLRQWYAKYHPDSGPLHLSGVEQLETLLGEEMRLQYAGMGTLALRTALSQRRKSVVVSVKVARTWCEKYATGCQVVTRSAASS